MKESLLSSCSEKVQQEIEYYKELTQAEFDVMDENTVRIAGTGLFSAIIRENEQHGFSVLEHVKRTGKPCYIQDRGNPICKRCFTNRICTCVSEMVYPMYISGRFLGSLSCLCYSDEAVRRMNEDPEQFKKLMQHLSDMIITIAKEALARHEAEGYKALAEDLVQHSEAPALLVENHRIAKMSVSASGYLENEGFTRLSEGQEVNVYKSRNSGDILLGSGKDRLSVPASYKLVTADMPFKRRLESILIKEKELVSGVTVQNYTDKVTLDYFVGSSPSFVAFKENALKLYKNSRFIFLTGERGTGKESWVRALHHSTGAPKEELVVLDCNSLYELSNFSGIFDMKSGLFSRKNVTLCLKEISSLAPWIQRKLSDSVAEMQENNIRLVATSTESPDELLRYNVISSRFYMLFYPEFLRIPPLREREIDVEYYINDCLEKYRLLSGQKIRIQKQAMEQLKGFPWPGNFKQMEHTISALIAGCSNNTISVEDVNGLPSMSGPSEDLNLKAREKQLIQEALRRYSGANSKAAAAEALGIGKATLYRKIREYELET